MEDSNHYSQQYEYEQGSFPIKRILWGKYKKIPSVITFEYYFNEKCIDKYITTNSNNIVALEYYYSNPDSTNYVENNIQNCLMCIKDVEDIYIRLIHHFEKCYSIQIIYINKTKVVDNLIKYFNKFKIIDNVKKCLNLLISTTSGIDLLEREITCPIIDFDLNYNEDFKLIHDLILEKLSQDYSKGLVLLHGEPGTGKTTYIRYLINVFKKRVIYIPPNMSNSLSEPTLIQFLVNHSNSILVIEDAENVLIKRGSQSSQAIANILNLTDGLLSDCANIQIIATFNTPILNIDKALLRKGRLIAEYEFKKLSEDRAKKLADKLGVNIDNSYNLSDIYNVGDLSFNKKTDNIGFK